MTVIRCVGIFETIKELIFKVLNTIPNGYFRVDVAADSYRTVYWKNKTSNPRGEANRTIMKSVETKILDSREFLNSNYNKTELVDQIFDWFKIKRAKMLNNLRTTNIYPSKENVCMITCLSVREVDELTQPTRKQIFG